MKNENQISLMMGINWDGMSDNVDVDDVYDDYGDNHDDEDSVGGLQYEQSDPQADAFVP